MPLQLEIVSPERRAFTDEVDMVVVPGIDGQLGILPHHTRLISALGVGELRIKKGGTEQSLLPTLGTGQGLWRIKHRSFVVQHQLHPAELELFDTTGRMDAANPSHLPSETTPDGGTR